MNKAGEDMTKKVQVLTKEEKEEQKKERLEQLRKKKIAIQEIRRKKEQQEREMDLKIKALEAGLPFPPSAKRKLETSSGMIFFRFIQTRPQWFEKIVNANDFSSYASKRPDVIKYLQDLAKSLLNQQKRSQQDINNEHHNSTQRIVP
jgi:hypothetical protein